MNRRRLASRSPAHTTPHDRIVAAARLAAPSLPASHDLDRALRSVPLTEHDALQATLAEELAHHAGPTLVAGTLDRRLILIKTRHDIDRWVVADLSGKAHQTRDWPAWTSRAADLHLDRPESWLSLATLDDRAVDRLTRPRVLLAALYHPEYFPLPRFPLAISDLARAARATLLGQVTLMDMQLAVTLEGATRSLETAGHSGGWEGPGVILVTTDSTDGRCDSGPSWCMEEQRSPHGRDWSSTL